jgi:hypothetical protein
MCYRSVMNADFFGDFPQLEPLCPQFNNGNNLCYARWWCDFTESEPLFVRAVRAI